MNVHIYKKKTKVYVHRKQTKDFVHINKTKVRWSYKNKQLTMDIEQKNTTNSAYINSTNDSGRRTIKQKDHCSYTLTIHAYNKMTIVHIQTTNDSAQYAQQTKDADHIKQKAMNSYHIKKRIMFI